MVSIRDRIKDFRRVPASALLPNPKNWRLHGDAQRAALTGVLREIGIADAVIARELDDGSLVLIDGHLRTDLLRSETDIPVLVLDVDETEADLILATLDPLASLADRAVDSWNALVGALRFEDDAANALLQLIGETDKPPEAAPPSEFPEYGEELEYDHQCPSCGYRWSGQAVVETGRSAWPLNGQKDGDSAS